MTGTLALNAAGETGRQPVLQPGGFSAGAGFDIVARGWGIGFFQRHRDGSPFAPGRRSTVVVVPHGTGKRAELAGAFADPASSGLPMFELVPPRPHRLLSAVSWLAFVFAAVYLAFGVTISLWAPYATKLMSLEYGMSGEQSRQIREAAEGGGIFGLRESDPSHADRPFHVRLREIREGAGR